VNGYHPITTLAAIDRVVHHAVILGLTAALHLARAYPVP
jgi:hypothetical protein